MYAVEDTNYPFHIVKNYTSIESLLGLLPPLGDIFTYLDLFQHRAQSCSYPQTWHHQPLPKRAVEHFLEDAGRNANNSPDTLALLFAMLATGIQIGQYDRSGGKWIAGAVQGSRDQSDVYSKHPIPLYVDGISNVLSQLVQVCKHSGTPRS